MNVKDFKKLLKWKLPNLKKPLFSGDPIRLFDEEYAFDLPTGKLNSMVNLAMYKLANEGFVPQEDYAENGADCDKWVRLILAEVEKQWIKEHEGQKSYPALPIGRWVAKGHMLIFGTTEADGDQWWNFGYLTHWDRNDCIEVEI